MLKRQAKEVKIGSTCSAIEYEIGDEDINGAVIKLRGRSPESGSVVNTKCKEMAYVMEGAGKIEIEGEKVLLNPEDMVIIEAGEKYFWDGSMTLFVSCTPAWTAEQSQRVNTGT